MLKAPVVLLLVCAVWGALAQPVYKWVDAEGKTHYSSQPPNSEKPADEVKLNSSSSFGGVNGGTFNPDGTKKIPKDVQELGDGFMKGLKKVDPKKEALNCNVAVENIHYQADLMLEVAQKNVRDGYLSQAEYDNTAPKIRQAKAETTIGDCQSASGNKRSFYQCMSNNNNHVLGCGSKYKY